MNLKYSDPLESLSGCDEYRRGPKGLLYEVKGLTHVMEREKGCPETSSVKRFFVKIGSERSVGIKVDSVSKLSSNPPTPPLVVPVGKRTLLSFRRHMFRMDLSLFLPTTGVDQPPIISTPLSLL